MATRPGFPPVPTGQDTYSPDWGMKMSNVVNLMAGKVNNATTIRLLNGAATTTMLDARLSAFSVIVFMPMTANAAAIHASIWVDSQGKGNCVIHHTNTANTDQTFGVGILG